MRLACMIALIGASIGVVRAADLPQKTYTPPPTYSPPTYAPVPVLWSGGYFGVNAGGAWGRSNWSGVLGGPFDISGVQIGGTVGYNWRASRFVLGIEADVDWSNTSGRTTTFCMSVCETRSNWLSTARGRVGYEFNGILPYITGGAAFGDVAAKQVGQGEFGGRRAGWTVGGGVEYALAPDWSAKIEYLHYDLGKLNCGLSCGFVAADTATFSADSVRVGVNFSFAPSERYAQTAGNLGLDKYKPPDPRPPK